MISSMSATPIGKSGDIDGSYAWVRLVASVIISGAGGVGLWSSVVLLSVTESHFGVDRAASSLPYTAAMVGILVGNIVIGRMVDRWGVVKPVLLAAVSLAVGYTGSANSTSLWELALFQGVLVGALGTSVTFGPLIAAITLWFVRYRGIAVALVACGSYVAGTVWPPIIQYLIDNIGWRDTHLTIAAACFVVMVPMTLLLRRPPPVHVPVAVGSAAFSGVRPPPLPSNALQVLLIIAGIACCVAMSMPQVHIVAYCVDLDIGAARGANMLALMLGLGIVSRIVFGFVMDRIGAARTLLIGSSLQAVCLLLYLPADSVVSLYLVSALFGLFQGGIVPSYAVLVRDYFPASQAGTRVGLVLSGTIGGMALGGWMSGAIYDLTLSYQAAFLNGSAWNLVNITIVVLLLWFGRKPPLPVPSFRTPMVETPLISRWPGVLSRS